MLEKHGVIIAPGYNFINLSAQCDTEEGCNQTICESDPFQKCLRQQKLSPMVMTLNNCVAENKEKGSTGGEICEVKAALEGLAVS